jgi:YfiR/HmsC-like
MDITMKILFLILLLTTNVQAQVSEYEYKAAFIERFTRFIEWPDEFDNDTFKIAVAGDNPFRNSLDELFDVTKINSLNTEIIYTNDINELCHANLVFISGSEKKRIDEILSELNDKPILIISDSERFCEMGTHINMYVDGNNVRYEINEEAIKKSGLEVSSLLLASARIVKQYE